MTHAYDHGQPPKWKHDGVRVIPASSLDSNTPQTPGAATAQMLVEWNAAIQQLRSLIENPDTADPFVPYGAAFLPEELPAIPAVDLPAGLPAWMQGESDWAARTGATAALKRRTITVEVPVGIVPAAQ